MKSNLEHDTHARRLPRRSPTPRPSRRSSPATSTRYMSLTALWYVEAADGCGPVHRHAPAQGVHPLVHRGGHGPDGVLRGGEQCAGPDVCLCASSVVVCVLMVHSSEYQQVSMPRCRSWWGSCADTAATVPGGDCCRGRGGGRGGRGGIRRGDALLAPGVDESGIRFLSPVFFWVCFFFLFSVSSVARLLTVATTEGPMFRVNIIMIQPASRRAMVLYLIYLPTHTVQS
jgi:hypothetical protein